MGGVCTSKKPVAPVAVCARPGCTNPTWNGAPGEYCSKACRPLCSTPGCGKPTWNGQPNGYCSQTCRSSKSLPPVCGNPGCGKPTWNGQPNEFCSQSCKMAALGGQPGPVCLTRGCGKPTWNGKPGGYCSMACKASDHGSTTIHASTRPSHPPPPAADGFLCIRPGCGNPAWDGSPGNYCSPPCRDIDPPICIQMGCGKPTWNGKVHDYCSKLCRDTRVCVRPGCGKPTWNGNPNEFCTHSCRHLGPPHVPAAAQVALVGPQSTLVEVSDPEVLQQFQLLLDATRKDPPNNWTRDRGCLLHGVGDPGCSISCACSNKVPVPSAYTVTKVEMNMNPALWSDYVKARDAIVQDCRAAAVSGSHYSSVQVETTPFAMLGQAVGSQPLVAGCNEWRLFHGSSRQACEGICETNFAVSLAGTGATWKKPGRNKGQPLYGYGIYLAERVTKADEYAKPEEDDLCSMLLCRVIGGRTRIITDNNVSIDEIKQEISSGFWDSILGDRVSTLDKPFREVVVYTNDQVLPEFIITYRRS